MFLSVFWKGRYADFMRGKFASEYFWVNLSRTMLHVYQMSYMMLIMQRTSFTSVMVYLDVIVNPAEYHELWNDSGTEQKEQKG